MKRPDKKRQVLEKNGGEREGYKMDKGDVFIWMLGFGLVVFAIASLLIYTGP